MVDEGQMAPDFTLQADDGNPVSLKNLRGKKVVLYFYPKDETPDAPPKPSALKKPPQNSRKKTP